MSSKRFKEQTIEPVVMKAPLFAAERRQRIVQLLAQQQRVAVTELSQYFSVSEVTIRKDLVWLEAHRLAVRTHGGAIFATPTPSAAQSEGLFEERERLQAGEKERIGEIAASYVHDGETIAMDASTTAFAMIPFLAAKQELTIVTNGLRTGMALLQSPHLSVLMPGGMVRRESYSLVGTWGGSILQQVHISKVFVGARGLTLAEGLTDVNHEEDKLKRMFVENAKEVIAVVDASKWGQVAFSTICSLERLHLIITDRQAPAQMVKQVQKLGIEILLV